MRVVKAELQINAFQVNYLDLDRPEVGNGSISFSTAKRGKFSFYLPNDGRYNVSMHLFDDKQQHGKCSEMFQVNVRAG